MLRADDTRYPPLHSTRSAIANKTNSNERERADILHRYFGFNKIKNLDFNKFKTYAVLLHFYTIAHAHSFRINIVFAMMIVNLF